MDQSDHYGSVMADDGVVVEFHHRPTRRGGGLMGQGSQAQTEVVMVAVRPDGSGVEVHLEKTSTSLLGGDAAERIRVTSDREQSSTFDRLERGAGIDGFVKLVQENNGGLEPVWIGLRNEVERQAYTWTDFPGTYVRERGFEVYAEFHTPAFDDQRDGIQAEYAYSAVADGVSGALVVLNVEQRALPFAG